MFLINRCTDLKNPGIFLVFTFKYTCTGTGTHELNCKIIVLMGGVPNKNNGKFLTITFRKDKQLQFLTSILSSCLNSADAWSPNSRGRTCADYSW